MMLRSAASPGSVGSAGRRWHIVASSYRCQTPTGPLSPNRTSELRAKARRTLIFLPVSNPGSVFDPRVSASQSDPRGRAPLPFIHMAHKGLAARPGSSRKNPRRSGAKTGVAINDFRACGGDRRGRPVRIDAGGGTRAGRDRCGHCRAAAGPAADRVARGRPARAYHRNSRSARNRRPVCLAGAELPDRRLPHDPFGYQRLSQPAQLPAGAASKQHRADIGRLDQRVGGADPSRTGRHWFRAGGWRRRRGAVRWPTVAGAIPRRLRRRAQHDPQGGGH